MKNGNSKYMSGSSMGSRLADCKHASPVEHIDVFAAQKKMNKGLKELPKDMRGYPEQAFKYSY